MTSEDRDFWINSAGSAARNPAGWYGKAESLWRAAGILRETWEADLQTTFSTPLEKWFDDFCPAPDVGGIYMMLAGCALEALIKGIIVAEKPAIVQPNPTKPAKMFDWKGSGHGLRKPLKDLEFPTNASESDVLRRLEVFVIWGGRYPVSMNALEMKHGPGQASPASFSTDDFRLLDTLRIRLRSRLEASARERQEANAMQNAAEKAKKRVELLRELKTFPSRQVNGVRLFEDINSLDEPGSSVSCCTCHSQFSLNARRPAAICKCGMLYHWLPFFNGSLSRVVPKVESYPS